MSQVSILLIPGESLYEEYIDHIGKYMIQYPANAIYSSIILLLEMLTVLRQQLAVRVSEITR